jgi:hypothetical protein
MGRLRDVEVPFPPLASQAVFAEHVASVRSIVTQAEHALATARDLERSLMARLLG